MEENQATQGAQAEVSDSAQNVEATEAPKSAEQAEAQGYPSHFVEKLKREQSNWRSRAKELEAKLKEREESELAEQNKYKELFEARTRELESARTQLTEYQGKMQQARKLAAVKTELNKLGIRPGKEEVAFKLMDLSKVAIDEDTETVIGADEIVKQFHEQYNDLGIWGKPTPRVSSHAPASEPVTRDINDLPLNEKLKMLAEMELQNPSRKR